MFLDPSNDRGHQIDGVSEKGQEDQAVYIFGKDNRSATGIQTGIPEITDIHRRMRPGQLDQLYIDMDLKCKYFPEAC